MSNISLTPTPNAKCNHISRIYVKSSTTQNKGCSSPGDIAGNNQQSAVNLKIRGLTPPACITQKSASQKPRAHHHHHQRRMKDPKRELQCIVFTFSASCSTFLDRSLTFQKYMHRVYTTGRETTPRTNIALIEGYSYYKLRRRVIVHSISD